jgi:hypothetical protein
MSLNKYTPNPERLIEEIVNDDYITITIKPNYKADAGWLIETERMAQWGGRSMNGEAKGETAERLDGGPKKREKKVMGSVSPFDRQIR